MKKKEFFGFVFLVRFSDVFFSSCTFIICTSLTSCKRLFFFNFGSEGEKRVVSHRAAAEFSCQ